MATATTAFLENREHLAYEPTLQTGSGTVRFEIIGEGTWLVTVSRGGIAIVNDVAWADSYGFRSWSCTFRLRQVS